ncbi:hypothetical protein B0T10DRAFT_167754 [Thelonectria olida]|uniref:Uncharacterized protein n=1 Tax=Thelonectria olida TaxID=1576542 RepID=A0A9P8WEP5_9HYPO|nr:hypothetical protein B0T10DRAFT_167754 [Thelonectria olida]
METTSVPLWGVLTCGNHEEKEMSIGIVVADVGHVNAAVSHSDTDRLADKQTSHGLGYRRRTQAHRIAYLPSWLASRLLTLATFWPALCEESRLLEELKLLSGQAEEFALVSDGPVRAQTRQLSNQLRDCPESQSRQSNEAPASLIKSLQGWLKRSTIIITARHDRETLVLCPSHKPHRVRAALSQHPTPTCHSLVLNQPSWGGC